MTLNRNFLSVFILISLVLSATAIYSFINNKKIIDSNNWVNHTYRVLDEFDEISTAANDAETRTMEYLVTYDPVFIKYYVAAKNSLNSHIDNLARLTYDNAEQQNNIALLKKQTILNSIYFGALIASPKSDFERIKRVIVSEQGRAIQDEIRRIIANGNNIETKLLAKRKMENGKEEYSTNIILIILFIVVAVVLAAIYLIIRSNLQALLIANKELAFQNREKENRAAELIIANEELLFQSEEKGNRAAELIIANKELALQNTEKEKRSEELTKVNRRYSFTSHINQAIVHINEEQQLFDEACKLAVSIGLFELAWIGILDEPNKKINLIAQCNATPDDLKLFKWLSYEDHGPIARILTGDNYYVINNLSSEPQGWRYGEYVKLRGFKSSISLAIKKNGQPAFTLNLCSSKVNFFNADEVTLLKEGVGDISFALDIFEKARLKLEADEKLRQSELKLKHAQEIAHIGSWESDLDSIDFRWSAEHCRIYGMPAEDTLVPYDSWISHIHPDDLQSVLQAGRDRLLNSGYSALFYRILRRDGCTRHIYAQTQFKFNSDGIAQSLYGVTHDVTEMKEAEVALSQSEANLHLIVDLIPQSIFVKDHNGRFLFVNKSFAALYGTTPQQIINKTLEEIMPQNNDITPYIIHDREVIDTGINITIPELKFTDHKGEERILYTTKVPYAIAGKNIKAVLGIAYDITEQKQAEAERSKIVADIVQRNKDLEQFSYIVSHNLRAPVANIIGLTDLMQAADIDTDEKKIMMDGLALSVNKLDEVISDLNTVLQVKHQVSENKEIIKFSQLLADIKVSIANLLQREDVEIVSDFSIVDEMLTLKSYLYSIFFNLISNSIKYHKPGIRPVIVIKSAKQGNKTVLFFIDNGLGIDLIQNGTYVFGMYKRFHNHTEGKGMGLYMVKTQVESLGGKITIESEINKGTTFKIVFENS